jgi:hypothetical protein
MAGSGSVQPDLGSSAAGRSRGALHRLPRRSGCGQSGGPWVGRLHCATERTGSEVPWAGRGVDGRRTGAREFGGRARERLRMEAQGREDCASFGGGHIRSARNRDLAAVADKRCPGSGGESGVSLSWADAPPAPADYQPGECLHWELWLVGHCTFTHNAAALRIRRQSKAVRRRGGRMGARSGGLGFPTRRSRSSAMSTFKTRTSRPCNG